MWFRVFGTTDFAPEPAAVLEHLHKHGVEVPGHFGGDDQGWFRADFVVEEEVEPLRLDRYLVGEEDLRDQLNAWAAWLESAESSPNAHRLMQHVIGAQQLFTMECPRHLYEENLVQNVCLGLCRFLAQQTAGVYQVDGLGFFAADGAMLLGESSGTQP
jgi:hypothetical protein